MKNLCFLLLAVLITGCALKTEPQQYITLGALLPLTGEDSDEGLRAFNGLQLAKNEINEAGGVMGKKLDIIVLNDRGDEKYIVQQYTTLKKRGVAAIIGSSYSGVTMALAKAAEKDGIPIISPTASNPEVTRGHKNVFRAIFIDDYQAEVMAYFAYNSLHARTALVFTSENSRSYKRASEVFDESFKTFGGNVIALESYSTESDVAHIINRYSKNPPDVVFYPEDYIAAANLVNIACDSGLAKTYILGSDAWDGLLAYVYNLDAMKHVFYSAPFSFDDQDEEVMQFVRNYFISYSQLPLSGSATAYTCVYILAEAIEKAGNTNKEDIIFTLKNNRFDTITGHIMFDENNNPHTNVYVIQIAGGEYSTYEKIEAITR